MEKLMSGTIEQQVSALALPLLQSMDLQLWGVRYRGGRDSAVLQIFIDSTNGIDADICGVVSNMLSPALDAADIIGPAYILEVSSPGMDRILFNQEQAKQYIGSTIKVELNIAMQSRRKFEGKLLALDNDVLSLDDKLSGAVNLALSNIALMRLVPEFKTATKKKGQ